MAIWRGSGESAEVRDTVCEEVLSRLAVKRGVDVNALKTPELPMHGLTRYNVSGMIHCAHPTNENVTRCGVDFIPFQMSYLTEWPEPAWPLRRRKVCFGPAADGTEGKKRKR